MVRLSPTQINLGYGGNQDNDPTVLTSAIQSPMRPTPLSPNMRYAHGRRLTTPTFKTTANELVGDGPGNYIKVTSACTQGTVEQRQVRLTVDHLDETLGINPRILYWKGGETDVGRDRPDLCKDSGRQRTSQTALWGLSLRCCVMW